ATPIAAPPSLPPPDIARGAGAAPAPFHGTLQHLPPLPRGGLLVMIAGFFAPARMGHEIRTLRKPWAGEARTGRCRGSDTRSLGPCSRPTRRGVVAFLPCPARPA